MIWIYDSELIFGWQFAAISLQIYFKFRNRSTWLNKGYLIAATYSSVQVSLTLNPIMIHSIFVGIEEPQMHYFHHQILKKMLFRFSCFIPSDSFTDVFGTFQASYASLPFLPNQIFPANSNFIYLTTLIAAHIVKSKILNLPTCRVINPLFRHLLNVKIFHSAFCFLTP